MEYYKPKTAGEAVSLKTDSRMYIAGGTDLGVLLSEFMVQPEALIDLTGIDELCGVFKVDEGVAIGACTGISLIAESELLPACLVEGAKAIGSPQIRNMATIGGNICNASPCGDTLTPLVVLEAVFIIEGDSGERRVKIEDFFIGPKRTCMSPEEILKIIIIPSRSPDQKSGFRMIGKRNGQAISQVNAAVSAVITGGIIKDIRIAAGSVAPVPLRLKKTEDVVRGKALGSNFLERMKDTAEQEVSPISDVRAAEEYRRKVAGSLLESIFRAMRKEAV
ncbi:MAG: xanthine dehydrogenase family protein subunit M [Spirochaetales bacterium]|nr:xanthine dehydrogenase family protein subunit M [Spirochaetales bacterium]